VQRGRPLYLSYITSFSAVLEEFHTWLSEMYGVVIA
jgi:hypothetical protein